MVRVAVTIDWYARRDYRSLLCAAVLLAGIAVLPTPTQSASSVRPMPQTQVFDPAAAQFFSLLSFGAMSVTAPIIYGDFVSPTALSLTSSGLGPMQQTMGLDPAVSTMLDGILQQGLLPGGLLPGGGSAEAEEFGVGSSGDVVVSNGVAVGLSGGVPTIGGAGGLPIITTPGGLSSISIAGGIQPVCSQDELATQLQAGGGGGIVQGVSAAPVQFPQGVFTGLEVGNPLGGLGPSGNRSNLSPPGPAGGWCRPPPGPFSESSPLENRLFWIGIAILLGGFLVFWLSRGMRLPA